MAKTGSVTAQMAKLLDEVDKSINDSAEKNAKDCAKGSASKLKNTSPKRDGSYASGWSYKKLGERDYIAFNKTEGWKTHILENGHVVRNKYGEYGRWNGIKHIQPVEAEFVDKFVQDCMRDDI